MPNNFKLGDWFNINLAKKQKIEDKELFER